MCNLQENLSYGLQILNQSIKINKSIVSLVEHSKLHTAGTV